MTNDLRFHPVTASSNGPAPLDTTPTQPQLHRTRSYPESRIFSSPDFRSLTQRMHLMLRISKNSLTSFLLQVGLYQKPISRWAVGFPHASEGNFRQELDHARAVQKISAHAQPPN